ncbi:MAG: ScpA family protein [Gallionella sp.]|nr:ScpA family protein [Gallionella sp.]
MIDAPSQTGRDDNDTVPDPESRHARIHGETMLQMPADLYIPPDALELVLDTFEGPLDLLLYLIRRHNLDVLDIPMAQLTRQYLTYIELLKRHKIELAAEYLLMAAVLVEIKSRLLLPKLLKASDEDEEDPRVELMRRLLEYEQMKLAAQKLNELPLAGRDFEIVRVSVGQTAEASLPRICVDDLKAAWLGLMARARLHTHHTVRPEQFSVKDQMAHILRCLEGGEYVIFDSLFDLSGGRPKLIVTFIAMLELAKEYLLEIQQGEMFGVIYVRSRRT